MNMLRRATEALARVLKRTAGETWLYRRGDDVCEVTVLIGRSDQAVVGRQGLMLALTENDVLVWREGLILGGELTEPQIGDELERVEAGVTEVWRVLPIADDRGHRASDPYSLWWRVHVKQVAA